MIIKRPSCVFFLLLFVVGAAVGCSRQENPAGVRAETTAKLQAALTTCDANVENCCPETGYTETVLTNNSDTFSSGTANLCVRALDGNDVMMIGPSAYVIGGRGDDVINAWGAGTVIPGEGADNVAVSGQGTVILYDICEAGNTEYLDGGGDGTLITPVPVAELTSRGVTVTNFGSVVLAGDPCKSTCGNKSSCPGGTGEATVTGTFDSQSIALSRAFAIQREAQFRQLAIVVTDSNVDCASLADGTFKVGTWLMTLSLVHVSGDTDAGSPPPIQPGSYSLQSAAFPMVTAQLTKLGPSCQDSVAGGLALEGGIQLATVTSNSVAGTFTVSFPYEKGTLTGSFNAPTCSVPSQPMEGGSCVP